MMSCVIFNSAAPGAAGPTRRGATAQEEKRSPARTTARNPNMRSFTVTIPGVGERKAIKGCTARTVPNHSAFRKRNANGNRHCDAVGEESSRHDYLIPV